MAQKHRFPIGTQYIPTSKKYICTVVDQLTTYNAAGEIVAIRYVSKHTFCEQEVSDRDVLETTIARAEIVTLPKN